MADSATALVDSLDKAMEAWLAKVSSGAPSDAAEAAAREACATVDAALATAELARHEREGGDSGHAAVAAEVEELQQALERMDRLVDDQRTLLESWKGKLARLRDATPLAATSGEVP